MTKADYNSADYLIIMDENNRRNLSRVIGPEKMLSFVGESRDVKDPWYTGNFDETYDDISKGCEALLAEIRKQYNI